MPLQKLMEKSSPIPKLRREAALGIAIKSGYRGIGIGTQIMKTLINESRKAGLKILVLNVFNTNKTARQLYEKMGFKETGKTPKYFYKDGRYIDEIHMVLELWSCFHRLNPTTHSSSRLSIAVLRFKSRT